MNFFNHLRNRRGITMIEMMITVVIIGIVSGMAMPRFQKAYERMQFRSTDREIYSRMRYARSQAITEKEPYGIKINMDAKTITLFKDIYNTGAHTFDVGDSVVKVDTLPAGYDYIGTDVTNDVFFFEKNGSAYFSGTGNIVTVATTEDVVSIGIINLLAATGRCDLTCYQY